MTISTSWEVDFGPMNELRNCIEPRYAANVDFLHGFEGIIKCTLSSCFRGLPEQFFECGVLKLLMKILFKMLHAESIMTVRKNIVNTFEETLLAVWEDD